MKSRSGWTISQCFRHGHNAALISVSSDAIIPNISYLRKGLRNAWLQNSPVRRSLARAKSGLQQFALALIASIGCMLVVPLAGAAPIGKSVEISKKYRPGDQVMQVRLLGTLELDHTEVNGYDAHELSGLAWDQDAGLLYAVSDDGFLCHLRPSFDGPILSGVELVAAYPLRDQQGKPHGGKQSDSEGLAIVYADNKIADDTELLVSFEITPRVLRYRPDGTFIEAVRIPTALLNIDNYADDNDALEAITLDKNSDLLIAPQRPLRGADQSVLSIYSNTATPLHFVPLDSEHSDIVGMETGPGGELVILERRYSSLFKPVIWAVRSFTPDRERKVQVITEILTLTTEGSTWSPDNFEGIAHHVDNRYFIVSDDNQSAIQRTLLMYFEILN
jgi:hypothetical protein